MFSCILILIDTGSPGIRYIVCLTMSLINSGLLINFAPYPSCSAHLDSIKRIPIKKKKTQREICLNSHICVININYRQTDKYNNILRLFIINFCLGKKSKSQILNPVNGFASESLEMAWLIVAC